MLNKIENSIILVTGGAGFIGSHLVDELLSKKYCVRVLDNLRNGTLKNLSLAKKKSGFEFFKGDILKKNDCNEAMKNVDVVYHLACLGVRHSIHSPFENHRVNAEGTLNVLRAAVKNKVRKFFYISTSEVYGEAIKFPLDEKSLTYPTTIYGASKLAGEHYSLAFHKCYGLNTTVLRIFNNYGPRAHYEGDAGELIPRTIISYLYDQQPIIFGDGKITRDFFYVKDTAKVLCGLLDIKGLIGETINIGTGEEITIKQVVEKISLLLEKKNIGIKYIESRAADVPRLWVNADKFKRFTKFKNEISFDDGLKNTIEYFWLLMKKKNLLSSMKIKNWEK